MPCGLWSNVLSSRQTNHENHQLLLISFSFFMLHAKHTLANALNYEVTALLHGDRDPSIAGMVLDSPFADLTQLCEEMVEKARDHGISKFVTDNS